MTQSPETFYDTLNVDTNASPEEIKSAFRAKIKSDHPDRNGSEQDFKRTLAARDVLLDSHERELYDDIGHTRYCNLKDYSSFAPSSQTRTTTTPSPSPHTTPTPKTTSTNSSNTSHTTTASASSQTNTRNTSKSGSTRESTSNSTGTSAPSSTYSINFPNPTIGITTLTAPARSVLHAMGWFVETVYRSVIAVHYGLFALLVSSVFIGTLARDGIPISVKIPASVLLIGMWAYMVLDWKLGVSGFLSAILLTTYDLNNTQFNPFVEQYTAITVALTIGLLASFGMKLYYDRHGLRPLSIMPKLAGWDEERSR